MLKQLHIQNYAIIDSIKIHFSPHLNIITGETGAGKSILMGALSLILGDRVDTSVLLSKDKKCFVEGLFSTSNSSVKEFLQNNELDCEEEIMIRREISVNGKSRAFINDTPVNLNQLKELSQLLVDLHRQFDSLELGDNHFQREVIDALAGNSKDIIQYQIVYKNYLDTSQQLGLMREEQASANREYDYNKFLFDELEEAHFSESEIENVDAEIKLMSNSENIKSVLSEVSFQMQDNEEPIIQQVKLIISKLRGLRDFHPAINTLTERLQSAEIELQDIASEIDQINDGVNYDAKKIDELNDRMGEGYRLLKKHNVQTTAELIEIKNTLSKELEKVTNLTDGIVAVENKLKEYYSEAIKIAEKISEKRKKQVSIFEEKVSDLLTQVGMPNAHIKVEIKTEKVLNAFGIDSIEFLFDANLPQGLSGKMAHFEPLRKVASGGELSRLMLSIKSLVAKSIQLPTLIFDEIDSGISGEAARQVGLIMKELAGGHQVISITHQPQIASKAETHFFVYKEIKNDEIITAVKELNVDERITTIAIMLSGERPTAAAFENAREMIGN